MLQIFEQFTITTAEVKELSDNCLEYKGDRCSQKWYTSSIYNSIKENDHIGKYKDFRLMHCKREASILSNWETQMSSSLLEYTTKMI